MCLQLQEIVRGDIMTERWESIREKTKEAEKVETDEDHEFTLDAKDAFCKFK